MLRRRLSQSILVLVGLAVFGFGVAAGAEAGALHKRPARRCNKHHRCHQTKSTRSAVARCRRHHRCQQTKSTTTTTPTTITATTATGPTTTTTTTTTTPTTTSTTPTTTTTTSAGTIPGCTPVPPPSTETSQCQFVAYTTGYGWWDNTPPGSSTISYPVIHQTAGGTGTYADPITLAVGHEIVNGQDIPEFTPGTIWYIPNFRRYFIVEDSCGDGNDPQNEACWDLAGDPADGAANPGAQVWLDLWTDGSQVSESVSNACEDAITDNHVAIMNPASDYAVVPGSIDGPSGCTQQYGDSIVTG